RWSPMRRSPWYETGSFTPPSKNDCAGSWPAQSPLLLDDGGDPEATGCADGDQAAPAPILIQDFRRTGDDASTGRRERMAAREAAALDVESAPIDRAERRVEPQLVLAVLAIFPGLQRAQHLRGEGFVDLVEIEILQLHARALQHARHRVRRRHQQAFFLRPREIDRSRFAPRQIRLHLVAA